MRNLDGKVALITGAGGMRAIGRATALKLASQGADIVLSDVRRTSGNLHPQEVAASWRSIDSVAEEIVQPFGDWVNFNPHVHVLAADGVFLADGCFVALPPVPGRLLAESFLRAMLKLLVKNGALSEARKQLAGTMPRAPMSLEKMTYDAATGTLTRRSVISVVARQLTANPAQSPLGSRSSFGEEEARMNIGPIMRSSGPLLHFLPAPRLGAAGSRPN